VVFAIASVEIVESMAFITLSTGRFSSIAPAEPRLRTAIVCSNKKGAGSGFRILELGIPFGSLVKAARFGWSTAWLVMMNELAPSGPDGEYKRPQASRLRKDSVARFPAEKGRYTLYAGVACPWCHRVLLAIELFGLQDAIKIEWLVPGDGGLWELETPKNSMKTMKEVYLTGDPEYRGRYTAPALLETSTGIVVCNESIDLVRMISEEFAFVDETDGARSLAERIHSDINNGVYMCGFAKTQQAYEKSIRTLNAAMQEVDEILSKQKYLSGGDQPGIADILLFPTVYRYENVYSPLFRCHSRSIPLDFPNIFEWACDMYQIEGVARVSDIATTENNYFENLFPLNPSGIIPVGPAIDFAKKTDRATNPALKSTASAEVSPV